jgi:4-amino-4-deoxychorismate lyase
MFTESQVRDRRDSGLTLIETMRWQPRGGFLRFERHMRRLAASAAALGMPFCLARAESRLRRCVGGDTELRVRLELDVRGEIRCEAQRFTPIEPDTVWRVAIARETRLDSREPLLRHKTNRRLRYDQARAEFGSEICEEVVLLNEAGMVCEGTITNLFVGGGDGLLLTPALRCGLLPGILREEMIEAGRAEEVELSVAALQDSESLFVGNSLRGLIGARIVQPV